MLDLRDAAGLEELRRAGDQESFYQTFCRGLRLLQQRRPREAWRVIF